MTVSIIHVRAKNLYNFPEVSTVQNYGGIYTQLSPFVLGPIQTYVSDQSAQRFENLWQFSKVYSEHLKENGDPNADWYMWRVRGWKSKKAYRYPMGRGRKPEYCWWEHEKLGYIEARKRVYARVYADNVIHTSSFNLLQKLYTIRGNVTLRDYDAYDHINMGMSMKDVINNPDRIMGQAFALAMILEDCLDECMKLGGTRGS